jgi:hypothetical protein
MTLCISNSSKQHHVFCYREPKENLLSHVQIRAGGQQEIGHGWSREQTDKVIAQLEHIGAHDAAEVHKRVPNFHGLLYRYEAPISADEILMGHESVKDMQNNRSVSQAVNGVLATDRSAQEIAGAKRRGGRPFKTTEVEVRQVPDGQPTGKETHFAVAVDPEGTTKIDRTAAA